jgi:hypothetical protein
MGAGRRLLLPMILVAIAWLLGVAVFLECVARAPWTDKNDNLPRRDHRPRPRLVVRGMIPVALACIVGICLYLIVRADML